MNRRDDPNPFDEEPEVNPFSNGKATPASKSRIPQMVASTLGLGQKHDATVDIPLDSMNDPKKKEKELAAWDADLKRRERDIKRREDTVAGANVPADDRNWPPFFPIIHHDIANEIPINAQRLQYLAFASWLELCSLVRELHAGKVTDPKQNSTTTNQSSLQSQESNYVPPVSTSIPRRLELPVFSGVDPVGWLARAEQYFELQQTPESQKVPVALIGMDGSALHWIRWLRQKRPDMSWGMLASEIIKRYDGRHSGNEFERLCSVRHSTTISSYIDEFIELVTHVPGLSDAHYLGYFMHGLQPYVRARLRTLAPATLNEAINSALCIEEEYQILSDNKADDRSYVSPTYGRSMPFARRPTSFVDRVSLPVAQGEPPKLEQPNPTSEKYVPPALRMPTSATVTSNHEFRSHPIRHLSDKEYKDLRSKGLCFRCKQPYHPLHKCPQKELQTIIGGEDEDIGMEDFEALERDPPPATATNDT